MSTMKDDIHTIRAVADRLEQASNDRPKNAAQVIARSGIQVSHTRNYVDLRCLGSSSYDARRMMCSQAGQQLGHFIADKLEYSLKSRDGGFVREPFPLGRDPYREEYTASVYVLTPGELTKLVEAAIQAGRCGA